MDNETAGTPVADNADHVPALPVKKERANGKYYLASVEPGLGNPDVVKLLSNVAYPNLAAAKKGAVATAPPDVEVHFVHILTTTLTKKAETVNRTVWKS